MMRGRDDKNRLSYWFPLIEAAELPVPATRIIQLTDEETRGLVMEFFGEGGQGSGEALRIGEASADVGMPFFLRTDFTSAKHYWEKTCFVSHPDTHEH